MSSEQTQQADNTVVVDFEDSYLMIYTVCALGKCFRDRQFKSKLSIGSAFTDGQKISAEQYKRFTESAGDAGTVEIDYQDDTIIVFTVTLDDGRRWRRHEDKRKLELIVEQREEQKVTADPLGIKSRDRFRREGPAYRAEANK